MQFEQEGSSSEGIVDRQSIATGIEGAKVDLPPGGMAIRDGSCIEISGFECVGGCPSGAMRGAVEPSEIGLDMSGGLDPLAGDVHDEAGDAARNEIAGRGELCPGLGDDGGEARPRAHLHRGVECGGEALTAAQGGKAFPGSSFVQPCSGFGWAVHSGWIITDERKRGCGEHLEHTSRDTGVDVVRIEGGVVMPLIHIPLEKHRRID